MKNLTSWLCAYVATLGPVGYLPAPGTMGTLCALPLLGGLRKLQMHMGYIDESLLVVGSIFLAVWVIDQALEQIGAHDPSEIVLDEVVGFIVTMMFFPLKVPVLVIGFFYFRLFDIIKPFGIQGLESIRGGWGIVLDDLAAALVARLALHITLKFFL